MRFLRALALLTVFAALPAAATDVSSNKDKSTPGSATTQSGASSTANANGSLAGGGVAALGGTSADSDYGLLRTISGKRGSKWWEVGVSFEVHRLFIQSDLEGDAANKLFNYYSAYAQADFTAHDRLSLSAGFSERFLADPGESGWRSSDISLAYTRSERLPGAIGLKLTAYLTAPTSFGSQLASLYTTPSASIALSRKFGDLTLEARGVGHYFIVQYATAAGGNPNPQGSVGVQGRIEYDMPFHRKLTIGLDAYTDWTWYYNVVPNNDPYAVSNGIAPPVTGLGQDIQQDYAFEVYLRYTLPTLVGINWDVTVALANGDPANGGNSVLHDGVSTFYLFWRQSAELYAVVSVRY